MADAPTTGSLRAALVWLGILRETPRRKPISWRALKVWGIVGSVCVVLAVALPGGRLSETLPIAVAFVITWTLLLWLKVRQDRAPGEQREDPR